MTDASLLFNTTPFPNALLDHVMPALRDTEWRVLCVIVRQTLGWQDGSGGRKTRDWLTQAQLKSRTGRDSEAISKAIETLLRRDLIDVQDAAGRSLRTMAQRRLNGGRLYYRLHPSLVIQDRPHHKLSTQKNEQVGSNSYVSAPKSRGQLRKIEQPVPKSEARNANTTKATVTKEILTKASVAEIFASIGEKLTPAESHNDSVDSSAEVEPTDTQVMRFLQIYLEKFKQHRTAEAPGSKAEDAQHLQGLLKTYPFDELAELLPIFLTSDIGYIRRQNYSLRAFTASINILKALREKSKTPASGSSFQLKGDRAWTKVGAVLELKAGTH